MDEWLVGRIDVVRQVRPIESADLFRAEDDGELAVDSNGKASYWICEAGSGGLQPGDKLIVTPLASFEGDGKDLVRWELPSESDTRAAE